MNFLQNIYNIFYYLFEILSFRTKPDYIEIDNNDEYEIIFYEKI